VGRLVKAVLMFAAFNRPTRAGRIRCEAFTRFGRAAFVGPLPSVLAGRRLSMPSAQRRYEQATVQALPEVSVYGKLRRSLMS
jgi:hypothetical protein